MSYKILLVEDEANIREIIVDKLRTDGIKNEIIQTENPLNALEEFNKNKDSISVLICDHYLPIENGLQLCDIIKNEKPNIKIIMFTGDPEVARNNDMSNIDIVLYKPDGVKKLSHHIKNLKTI